MKIPTIGAALLLAAASASATDYVNGYSRSDGTYVQGHYRSSANNTQSDNWSTRGNSNPYTGQAGTRRDCTYGCN